MVVVLVLAALAVLGAVVALAMGRGGELARVQPDHPPLPLAPDQPITGPEAALLRLPRGLWGYQVAITDEALHRLAHALSERDARMAALEREITDLRLRLGDTIAGPRPELNQDGGWLLPDDLLDSGGEWENREPSADESDQDEDAGSPVELTKDPDAEEQK